MSSRMPITVFILSHNEAVNLPRCIGALAMCDDVVVVDDGSADDSQAVAREHGARVVAHPFTNFAEQRNAAMEQSRHAWTLHLDADEVMTPTSLDEVAQLMEMLRPNQVGFIARKVMLENRWLKYSADYPVYVPRLVHRDGPRFEMRGHGEVMSVEPGAAYFLKEPMLHYAFSKGWADWRERHERYAKAEAQRLADGPAALSLCGLWSSDRVIRRRTARAWSYRLPGRPTLRFLYLYVLRGGFMDGGPGFRYCRAMASYERMINRQWSLRKKAS